MKRPSRIWQFLAVGLALLAAGSLQTRAQAPAIVRTPIAGTTLPSVADAPRSWKLLRVELRAGDAEPAPPVIGLVYVLSGTLAIQVRGQTALVHSGEGAVLKEDSGASLVPEGKEKASYLHFLLLKPEQMNLAHYPADCAMELYRTSAPLPGLKAGPYAFNLTRVTFPPHMPPNAPHHRSGGALYYVLSGTGSFATGGTTTSKPPEIPHYEPFGMVHQWGNPGDEPLTFLAANLNPEGTAAVVPGSPAP
jgi:quercetin dioxygenase-like cupin family protein